MEEAGRLGVGPPFPPGSPPSLSLIERPWKFVKREVLGASRLDANEAFTSAIGGRLDELPAKHKVEMDALLTLNFQRFDDVPMLPA